MIAKVGFGGGCHWCTEAVFQHVPFVQKVDQGWIAPKENPVHFSEGVIVLFDDEKISLYQLIEVHLYTHSSTVAHSMRDKYVSAVYVFNQEQADNANQAISDLQASFSRKIITRVLHFNQFKANKLSLQNYYKKNPDAPFCNTFIKPKLEWLHKQGVMKG